MNSLGRLDNKCALTYRVLAHSGQTNPIAPMLLCAVERPIRRRNGVVGSRLPVWQDRGDADADSDVIGHA